MNTPQTDTPETDEIRQSYEQRRASVGDILEELGSMERRAIAAEARVKELEAANAELIERLLQRAEANLAAARRDVQTIQQQAVELDRLRAALRLRPIAEAGPVPEGTIRVYADFINGDWEVTTDKWNGDTHFIDIYPPGPPEEGQARP
jgi:hypothetical protein